jgi:hypothetical protein
MNLSRLSTLGARWTRAHTRVMASISQASWPFFAGLGMSLLALPVFGVSLYLHQQAIETAAIANRDSQKPRNESVRPMSVTENSAPKTYIPDETEFLDDVASLFKLAADQKVSLGPIEYRVDTSSPLPITVRTLDLRLNETYPAVKDFLAQLLVNLPHVNLQEVRVDRQNSQIEQGQITLKLSLVYRKSAKSTLAVNANSTSQMSADTLPRLHSDEGK